MLINSSIFTGETISLFKNGMFIKEELSYEIIDKYAVQISESFYEFIHMIENGC
jgi:hypothetical protein